MKQRILIILGNTNSSVGTIGMVAKSRLDYCLKIRKATDLILCTGGWGTHFNTTKHPHASYAKSYLQAKGVDSTHFLEFGLSSHTVEDATTTKKIIEKYPNVSIVVITSDFHKKRVSLIFNEIIDDRDLSIIGVKSPLNDATLKKITVHEEQAVTAILENGLYYE